MSVKLACIQFRTSCNRAGTLAKAAALIQRAANQGAKMAVLPEAFTGIYGVQHFEANAEEFCAEHSGSGMMQQMAKEHGMFVVGGVIEAAANVPTGNGTGVGGVGASASATSTRLHNTVYAFGPDGEVRAQYRKLHLSKVQIGDDNTSEGSVLTAGSSLSSFDIDGTPFKVGLLNCFDLRFPDASTMLARQHGCNVLLYPSAWLQSSGALGHWDCLLRARALDNQCFVAGINVAQDDEQPTVCYGRTCVVDPLGQHIATCADDTADEVVFADLEYHVLDDVRTRIPLGLCARTDVYG